MFPLDPGRRRVPRSVATGLPLALAAALVAAGTATAAPSRDARVTRTATLGEIPLGAFSNALLPGSVDDDHGVKLGGIGSDIYPAGREGEYWTVTDRGPNGQIKVDGKKRRTFPVPGFDPAIVKIRVCGDSVQVVDAIPLTTSSGKAVTGLPDQQSRDEAPYTYDARTPLSYNPNGLDTEGIVRAADGTFWLVDEYGPSLIHVSARGQVLTRYVPEGLGLTGTDYPVVEALPSVFLHRKINRGFEGLAQLPDGDLVLALQSPLSLPDADAGNASRTTRLLRFSPREKAVTAEYAYRFDPVNVSTRARTTPPNSRSPRSSPWAATGCSSRNARTRRPGCSWCGWGASRASWAAPGTTTRPRRPWSSWTIRPPPACRCSPSGSWSTWTRSTACRGRSRASRA